MGGALEARGISASGGRLSTEASGEIGLDGDTLVIKRIHAQYHLKLEPANRETAERVHGFHKERCPVARSIGNCVEITTSLEMTDIE